ncbi:unnamed protein product [Brassica oleracea var. botrytis]
MIKREFPLSVYNLNILLEGLCKNLEYGKTVILLREVRLSSPDSDAVCYMTVIRGLCEGKQLEKALELLNDMQGIHNKHLCKCLALSPHRDIMPPNGVTVAMEICTA